MFSRGLPAQYPGLAPLGGEAYYAPILLDGREYAVVRVRESALDALPYPDEILQHLTALMGRPAVLMSDRTHRVYGPHVVAAYLSQRPVWALPWRRARAYFD